MRVLQHWKGAKAGWRTSVLGDFQNLMQQGPVTWSNAEVSSALRRTLDKRPPKLPSQLSFKENVGSSVCDRTGWKLKVEGLNGRFNHISPLSLSKQVCHLSASSEQGNNTQPSFLQHTAGPFYPAACLLCRHPNSPMGWEFPGTHLFTLPRNFCAFLKARVAPEWWRYLPLTWGIFLGRNWDETGETHITVISFSTEMKPLLG